MAVHSFKDERIEHDAIIKKEDGIQKFRQPAAISYAICYIYINNNIEWLSRESATVPIECAVPCLMSDLMQGCAVWLSPCEMTRNS